MDLAEAGERRRLVVELRVVLHGARPERVEVGVDREVELAQQREVPDQVELRHLRQLEVVPEEGRVGQFGHRHVTGRNPDSRAARHAAVHQQVAGPARVGCSCLAPHLAESLH